MSNDKVWLAANAVMHWHSELKAGSLVGKAGLSLRLELGMQQGFVFIAPAAHTPPPPHPPLRSILCLLNKLLEQDKPMC